FREELRKRFDRAFDSERCPFSPLERSAGFWTNGQTVVFTFSKVTGHPRMANPDRYKKRFEPRACFSEYNHELGMQLYRQWREEEEEKGKNGSNESGKGENKSGEGGAANTNEAAGVASPEDGRAPLTAAEAATETAKGKRAAGAKPVPSPSQSAGAIVAYVLGLLGVCALLAALFMLRRRSGRKRGVGPE
ncbi:MAG: hypothetical protein RDV41_07035, partial [Planctomycetota bacterium]|nr:hypothetical protein [Planctomycetota bacterium]